MRWWCRRGPRRLIHDGTSCFCAHTRYQQSSGWCAWKDAWDSFKGEATSAQTKSFCQRYIATDGRRFNRSVYGEEGAWLCAHVWCSKMAHFFEIWRAAGQPTPFTFETAHHEAWQEPPDFSSLVEEITTRWAQKGFEELRQLKPRSDGTVSEGPKK